MATVFCRIEQGQLRGLIETNVDGEAFHSFLGIPYAKPPIEKLRFMSPQPPKPWDGIRDATKHGNPCHALHLLPTPEAFVFTPTGSEDCLYLNVYTRELPSNEHNPLKPVMVFIHGGAFISGSGDRSMYGPEFLMTEDIVLVTINYRLGALGFLTIDEPSLGGTGNAGLKDQVQALKWVNKNIKLFGGDPDNVTIFGESAGGCSVHYLVLSPLAKGLFHKAILQSASVLCPFGRGVNNARKLAEAIGFSESDPKKLLEFLQGVPVKSLIEAQTKLGDWLSPVKKRNFGPTIEPVAENAFIWEDPVKLIESGKYNQVPLMFGYTSLEGIFEEGNKLFGFQTNWEEFVPYFWGYEPGSDMFNQINKKIIQFYFGTDEVDLNNKEAVYLAFTDAIFLRGIHLAVKAHSKTSQNPVYYYRMSIDTDLNMFKNLIHVKAKGVCHGDDLGYLFKIGNSVFKPGTIEETAVRRFVKMWTNFARTGNPTPVEDSLLNVKWKPVIESKLNFLDIGSELISGVDPDMDRMNFWDELTKDIKKFYY